MQSSIEQLRQRGFVPEEDERQYSDFDETAAVELLVSPEAHKRTIGIKLLSRQKNEVHLPLLCEILKSEKKLYTKIALCECLEAYGEAAIPHLTPLLGTIGNNQHKKIDVVDLDKKSFPLPRDITARILIRIGPSVFPELKKILMENKNRDQVSEAIDVIGHITWNFHDFSLEKVLLNFYHNNLQDEFLVWKLVRSFQSFNSDRIKNILEDVSKNHHHKVIVKEAERSLERMKRRLENNS